MKRFAGVSAFALGLAFAIPANADAIKEDWKPGFMVRVSTNLDWSGNSLYPNDPLFEGGTLGSWGGQSSSFRLDEHLGKLPTENLAFAPAVFEFSGKFKFREPGSYRFAVEGDLTALERDNLRKLKLNVHEHRENAVWDCSAVGTMAGQYSMVSFDRERFGYGHEKGFVSEKPKLAKQGDSAFEISKVGEVPVTFKKGCYRAERDFTKPSTRLPGLDRLMTMPDRKDDEPKTELIAFPKFTWMVSKDGEPFRPIRNDEVAYDATLLKSAGVAVVKSETVKTKDGVTQGFVVTKGVTKDAVTVDDVSTAISGTASLGFTPIFDVASGSSIELKSNLLVPKDGRYTVAVAVSKVGPDKKNQRVRDLMMVGPGAETPAAVSIQLGDKVAKGIVAPARDSSELVVLDQGFAEPSAAPLTIRVAVPKSDDGTSYKVRLLMIGADDALLRQIRQVDVMNLNDDLPENLRNKAPAASTIQDGKAAVFTVK